jgi:hypothetical protein
MLLSATHSVLRQVITLADDAATLPDKELRDRLLALAEPGQAGVADRPHPLKNPGRPDRDRRQRTKP